jgi:hypothetical protein
MFALDNGFWLCEEYGPIPIIRVGSGMRVRLQKDRRGVIAFETLIAIIFIITFFLLPIADFVLAWGQYISAYQALRDLGQYTQYHTPPDVTNWSSWASSLPTITGYTITTSVMCGDTLTACGGSPANTASPKYYSFSTSITIHSFLEAAIPALSSLAGSHTLTYTEQFQ